MNTKHTEKTQSVDDAITSNHADTSPPLFPSWKYWYALVLCFFIAGVVIMWWFSRAFR